MSKKNNFSVKLNKKLSQGKTSEECNEILIRNFQRKWKISGIAKELRDKSYPITKGMKERKKRYLGKRRKNSNQS